MNERGETMGIPSSWMVITIVLVLAMAGALPATARAQTGNVCVQCHGNLPGRLGEPAKLWQGSIHAANGVYCNECHGGDPKEAAYAMSPERGFMGVPKERAIPDVCGRCHIGVRKDYLASVHGKALGAGGPNCVTCHGNHAVRKASLELINETSCGRCHSYGPAGEIRDAMRQTENRILSIDAAIAGMKSLGADTDKLEKGLFNIRNHFHTLSHNVNVAMVKGESARIGAQLQSLSNALQGMADDRRRRKIAGVFVVGGALLAALFFHLLRKTYE